jgi:hypothetical protein
VVGYVDVHYATINPFGSQQLRPMISADHRQNVVKAMSRLELRQTEKIISRIAPSPGRFFHGISRDFEVQRERK